jgi:hypothetical protein
MRVWLVVCFALVTPPCAGDPTAPPAARAPAPPAPPAAATETETPTAENKTPENVRVVTIDPTVRPPVCRRVVPTGSRIAEQRCETPNREATAADEATRTVLRRDFETLRDQQMMREQARQAAMAEALRRRGQ